MNLRSRALGHLGQEFPNNRRCPIISRCGDRQGKRTGVKERRGEKCHSGRERRVRAACNPGGVRRWPTRERPRRSGRKQPRNAPTENRLRLSTGEHQYQYQYQYGQTVCSIRTLFPRISCCYKGLQSHLNITSALSQLQTGYLNFFFFHKYSTLLKRRNRTKEKWINLGRCTRRGYLLP